MIQHTQTITKIAVPQPCKQHWGDMTANPNGRFCSSCAKIVIDFTVMSNQQIIDHLSGSAKVCGRFDEVQIVKINQALNLHDKTKNNFWKGLALAAMMLLVNQSKSQPIPVKPGVEQTNEKLITDKVVKQDSIRLKTIKGIILSADDGLPLPGTAIKVTGTNMGTQADAAGNFVLNVPPSTKELTVTFIGFEAQTVKLDPDSQLQEIKLSLKMRSMIMGEIIIKRPSFVKRAYYRCVRNPRRKVKHIIKKIISEI